MRSRGFLKCLKQAEPLHVVVDEDMIRQFAHDLRRFRGISPATPNEQVRAKDIGSRRFSWDPQIQIELHPRKPRLCRDFATAVYICAE